MPDIDIVKETHEAIEKARVEMEKSLAELDEIRKKEEDKERMMLEREGLPTETETSTETLVETPTETVTVSTENE